MKQNEVEISICMMRSYYIYYGEQKLLLHVEKLRHPETVTIFFVTTVILYQANKEISGLSTPSPHTIK